MPAIFHQWVNPETGEIEKVYHPSFSSVEQIYSYAAYIIKLMELGKIETEKGEVIVKCLTNLIDKFRVKALMKTIERHED